MSKNNNNAPKGEQKKAPKAPKAPKGPSTAPQASAASQEEETANVVTIPMAADAAKLTDRKRSGLSPDGQVRLLDLARRTFVEETDPDLQFPKTVRKKINNIVAVGIMCTFAEHASNGDNQFALVLKTQGYNDLVEAAKAIGYTIPDIKALPAGTEEGTVMLEASKAKIPAEVKEQLQHEKKVREGVKPELDPTKISSEEDLKKALEYMFVSSGGKRLPVLLTESIDFMKKFREHEAELAENTEEAKARFANYNAGNWLDDIFSYFCPPIFFSGIGRGMANVTDIEKSPIHAFTIFRDAIKDKDTKQPVLEDQEIAFCVKSIIKWVCNTNINSNQKAIENLDKTKNKKEIETCKAQIQKYNNILTYITSPSSEEVDNLLENQGTYFDEASGQLAPECQKANATFNRLCKTFYGKEMSTADYKNLDSNIQQYGGYVLNLFLDAGSQLASYKLANITELEERTAEEREALLKEAKKAWLDKKTKSKEEEAKNA